MTTTTILTNSSGISLDPDAMTGFVGSIGKVIAEWGFRVVRLLPMFYEKTKWLGLETAKVVGEPSLVDGFTFLYVILTSYMIIRFLTGAGRKGQTVLTILGLLATVSILGYYVFGWGR